MYRKITALILILPLLLTGCWDRQELNDQAIVLGWGMDLEKEESTWRPPIWCSRSLRNLADSRAGNRAAVPAS